MGSIGPARSHIGCPARGQGPGELEVDAHHQRIARVTTPHSLDCERTTLAHLLGDNLAAQHSQLFRGPFSPAPKVLGAVLHPCDSEGR